jgi:peptide/nickel transport system ATP-binding protein
VFAPRCALRTQLCTTEAPPSVELDVDHVAICHRAGEIVRESQVRSLRADQQTAAVTPLLAVRAIDVGYRDRQVIHGANFDIFAGECVALVGESGSGKTTLSRAIVGLAPPSAGRIEFAGRALAGRARDRSAPQRRAVQYIFQNPYSSLNPRRLVGDIVRAPLRWLSNMQPRDSEKQVTAALERVGLGAHSAYRYADELSGGERQRVALARALACRPDIIVCDEITSALDASVQAAILDLLERLRREEHLALLFVTHNLALVRTLADRIAVLRNGAILELGPTDRVLDRPSSSYTAELIRKTPSLAVVT